MTARRRHFFPVEFRQAGPLPSAAISVRVAPWELMAGGAVLTIAFLWAYWPTLQALVWQWEHEPDYSHGYLVLPLACGFLWWRRKSFPTGSIRPDWRGVSLLLAALGVRAAAGMYRMVPVDGWSIILWAAGCVWLLGGRRLLWWTLPSIVFLVFMVPLPYRVERWFRLPLQHASTAISSFVLTCLGAPALSEGNTILLGDHRLEVEDACSGLRIFVGVFAMAAALCIVTRGRWWDRLLLLASAVPAALLANSTRVVATALLYERASSTAGRAAIHDAAGWGMMPVAALLLVLAAWYWRRLLPEVEQIGVDEFLRRQRA